MKMTSVWVDGMSLITDRSITTLTSKMYLFLVSIQYGFNVLLCACVLVI